MSHRSTAAARNTRSRKAKAAAEPPDVYNDMLLEAASASPTHFGEEGRPLKRRRTRKSPKEPPPQRRIHTSDKSKHESSDGSTSEGFEDVISHERQQTTWDDSHSSDGSDVGWEEIDLDQEQSEGQSKSDEETAGDLDLVLDQGVSGRKASVTTKRKGPTREERKQRLEIHKMHILCLLAHVETRNNWCNDVETQAVLKPLLPNRTISYLNPNMHSSQFQRSRSFMDGLAQANELWKEKWKITARGLKRCLWAEDSETLKSFKLPEDIDPPMEKSDFRRAANDLEGSRDVGSQLYCALLRSVGVEARLVSSLQLLPFASTASKGSTPKKTEPALVVSYDGGHSDTASGIDSQASETRSDKASVQQNLVPKRARRLGMPSSDVHSSLPVGITDPLIAPAVTPKRKRIRESRYPVYWVECFNEALQKWIPVDPLTTNTIAKASKFEPPSNDHENSMSYVIAIEEDNVARDVTRRYVKAFNAKTRKSRVEIPKGGEKWWRKSLRRFTRGWNLDRDQVEDAELAAREAQEPMPRNVQDFKDHPHYALERHLRRNEVIYPKSSIGRVATGKSSSTAGSKALEPIYRRRDVHVVKSSDGWYRVGREIKPGEQPLKHAKPRNKRYQSLTVDNDFESPDDDTTDTGLYAFFQTIPYEPPPVVNGRVPKNSYGNLDLYVPSMIPRGGAHIPYPEAAQAARLIGVDHAAAVTGFQFRGRHGTAILCGIVAAAEYAPAIEAVVDGYRDARAEEEELRKGLEALRLWKRFFAALRIKQRIEGYDVEGASKEDMVEEELEKMDEADDEFAGGGGFFPDQGSDNIAQPTAGRMRGTDMVVDPMDGGGGFFKKADAEPAGSPYQGGGFFVDDDVQTAEPPPQLDSTTTEEEGFLPDASPPGSTDLTKNTQRNESLPTTSLHTTPPPPQTLQSVPPPSSSSAATTMRSSQARRPPSPPPGRPIPHSLPAPHLPPPPSPETRLIETPTETHATASPSRAVEREPEDVHEERRDQAEAPAPVGTQEPTPSTPAQVAEESEAERGSLLSHDPEDEDADPEWLVDG
ncbi:MAG: hypothetical protein M1833_003043 [Piccolia ochrophora]|nr:MAG: hypothetical protein M1833_003043 [Piccolia ochrophora]